MADSRTPDPAAILHALGSPVLHVDGQDVIRYVNTATELLFESSAGYLVGRSLSAFIPADSPLVAVVGQVRETGARVAEYGITIDTPRTGHRQLSVQAAPMEGTGGVVLTLHEESMAHKLGRQMQHRGAARSVTGMAAVLAHEVKNPLSGVRGAAQLLEQEVDDNGRQLARLIREETDRVVTLIDRMEVFSDKQPMERGPVNIHAVLEHVKQVATSGFARNVRIVEHYDPSLPPVHGNRDRLVQVFLNLVKNAAEAVAQDGTGEITLSTAYQHGIRFAVPGTDTRQDLPLVVTVQDNGPGIPEDLAPHLFDPFVGTKQKGSGLGLAVVAKMVDDHGGTIEWDTPSRGTLFRIMLPMSREEPPPEEEDR